jgi:FkbM family methyltransferase
MYLLLENSSSSDDPLFMKLQKTNQNLIEKQLLFFPEQSVAKWFFESGISEKSLITWITDVFISSDKDFVDIGAHVGTYSLLCGKKANHTHAFECNPKVFCYLASNVALHEMEYKITPYRYALGDKEDILDYYIRSEDGGGNGCKVLSDDDMNRTKVKVHARTLDSFQLNNVGFIKIDVEGFEKEVILGSLGTLIKNNYPKIVFESWGDWKEKDSVPSKKIKKEVFTVLEDIGYKIIPIDNYQDMYLAEYFYN